MKITLSHKDPHKCLSVQNRLIDMEGLSSLISGERKKPISTIPNPTGYSPPYMTFNSLGDTEQIPADNIGQYNSDIKRLKAILLVLYDESVHHLAPEAFNTADPREMYDAVHRHFKGQWQRDIMTSLDTRLTTLCPSSRILQQ